MNGCGGEFCAALEKAGTGNAIHKYPCAGVDFPQGVLENDLKLLDGMDMETIYEKKYLPSQLLRVSNMSESMDIHGQKIEHHILGAAFLRPLSTPKNYRLSALNIEE